MTEFIFQIFYFFQTILTTIVIFYIYKGYKALKKDKESFEVIIDKSDNIIFTKDLNGNYTFVNNQFAIAQRAPIEEIIGKNDVDLYPEEFAINYKKHDQIVIDTKKPIQFNEIDPLQPEISFITSKFPLLDDEGEIYGIGGIVTDVSEKISLQKQLFEKEINEKKILENQLKDSLHRTEKRLNAIVDNNPDWIVVIDKFGNWLDHHDTKLNQLPEYIKNANPIGKKITDFLSTDFQQYIMNFINKCLDSQSIIKNESDGANNQYFEEYYVPLSENEVMIIIRNITERKSTELALKQRTIELEKINQQQIEFSYVLSHDLKAPLTVLKIIVESLLKKGNPELIHDLKKMNSKINSMIQLINGILRFFEVTLSKENLPSEIVDCNIIIREVLENLEPSPTIEIKILSNLPKLNYYKIRIYQVFQNLISNAIKYNNKEKGIIEISCEKSVKENFHIITIADNGIGISKEDQNKIFNLFSTPGKNIDDNDSSRTGIGLNIVKSIIENMGGRIEVSSEINVKTTFLFTIPDFLVVPSYL
jgi:signal transduction histidine kinase